MPRTVPTRNPTPTQHGSTQHVPRTSVTTQNMHEALSSLRQVPHPHGLIQGPRHHTKPRQLCRLGPALLPLEMTATRAGTRKGSHGGRTQCLPHHGVRLERQALHRPRVARQAPQALTSAGVPRPHPPILCPCQQQARPRHHRHGRHRHPWHRCGWCLRRRLLQGGCSSGTSTRRERGGGRRLPTPTALLLEEGTGGGLRRRGGGCGA